MRRSDPIVRPGQAQTSAVPEEVCAQQDGDVFVAVGGQQPAAATLT